MTTGTVKILFDIPRQIFLVKSIYKILFMSLSCMYLDLSSFNVVDENIVCWHANSCQCWQSTQL